MPTRLKEPTAPQQITRVWVAWHVVAALGILGIATEVRHGNPFWDLSWDRWAFIIGLAVTHLTGALAIWWQTRRGDHMHVGRVIVTMSAAYGLFALAWLVADAYYSRPILAISLVLSLVLTALATLFAGHLRRVLLPVLAFSVFALGAADVARHREPIREVVTQTRVSLLTTTFHNLQLTRTTRHISADGGGGSIRPLSAGFLIAVGDGSLYYLDRISRSDDLDVRPLPYRAPINRDAFLEDKPDARWGRFRIGDILIYDDGAEIRLLASHHYWRSESQCFVLRLSMTQAERGSFLDGTADIEWRTLFDAEPCLPIRDERRATEGPFSGHMAGGRIIALDASTVLLAVGDHAFDGLNAEQILAQDPDSHYGKMIQIDVASGAWEIFSTGHRNPQGLHALSDGRIWSTEHGPQGGDELNLVTRGSNYGWPFETYGVQYGEQEWPLSAHQGQHTEYEAPVFSWVPSIAVTSLITVEQNLFPSWQGDLLVASLKGTLFRLRHSDRHIVFAEPIRIGNRIRDLAEASDGRIILLFDDGSLGVLEPAPSRGHAAGLRSGALLFAECQGCHAIGDGSRHGIGPDLGGVVGRDIASSPDYDYSTALEGLPGRWTPEQLARFLAAPSEYAPGTTMEFEGLPDLSERLLLIAYLRTAKQASAVR